MTTPHRPPLMPADHIAQAKDALANGADPRYATAHALIAIAELMATNMTNAIMEATTAGALAATEAFGSILSVVNPGAAAVNNINTYTEPPQHDCEYDDPSKCGWPGHRR